MTEQPQHTLVPPATSEMRRVVTIGLAEDLRWGPDVTTLATVAPHTMATAEVRSREAGIVCGAVVAEIVLDEVIGAGKYNCEILIPDGGRVAPGDTVMRITAPTQDLLTAERTLLNIMTHLSGIATATDQWMQAMRGASCVVRDTRKTLPGLRELEKYAVRAGGGMNHRMGLGDAALIKDNHVVAAGGVVPALQAVKAHYPDIPTEVEVDSLDQLREVLDEGVGLVLLDNMDLDTTQKAVALRDEVAPSTKLESSGGLTLEDAADYAAAGVDYVAVGALTHSVKVLDLGLDM